MWANCDAFLMRTRPQTDTAAYDRRAAQFSGIGALVGARCCHCRTAAWPVCHGCQSAIVADVAVSRVANLPVVSAARYSGPLRSAILAAKRTGNKQLRLVLARVLEVAIIGRTRDGTLPGEAAVVPVPSGGQTYFANGGDFAAKLLERLERGPTGPQWHVVPMLSRRPFARAQKQRGRATRGEVGFLVGRRNVVGSGQNVLLLDDVMTTGSSLRSAAHVLTVRGFNVSGALVLARV